MQVNPLLLEKMINEKKKKIPIDDRISIVERDIALLKKTCSRSINYAIPFYIMVGLTTMLLIVIILFIIIAINSK